MVSNLYQVNFGGKVHPRKTLRVGLRRAYHAPCSRATGMAFAWLAFTLTLRAIFHPGAWAAPVRWALGRASRTRHRRHCRISGSPGPPAAKAADGRRPCPRARPEQDFAGFDETAMP